MAPPRFMGFIIALAAMSNTPIAYAQTERAQPVVLPNETIVRVNGEATVRYRPEVMEVSIGVVTTGSTAADALAQNNTQSSQLIEAIYEAGIKPDDVKTTDLSVEPQYAENGDIDRIIGWRTRNEFSIKTERILEAGTILNRLIEIGGNTLGGPVFDLTALTRLRATREAEAAALTEARDQADATAKVMGMRVKRVLLVSDSRVAFDRSGGYIVVTGSRVNRTSIPIEPGDVAVEATYSVEYALVPM